MPATVEWDVTNLLEVLLQEINSREFSNYMSHTNFKQNSSWSEKYGNDNRQSNCTASAMHSDYSRDSGSSNPTCTFCEQNHSSAKYNINRPRLEKSYITIRLNVLFVYVPAIKRVNVNVTTNASNAIQNIIYLFVTFMV